MKIFAEEVREGDFAGFGNNRSSSSSSSSTSSSSSSSPRSFSPLTLVKSVSQKNFSYGNLPLEPVRLVVLKLDGSSFDIVVTKRATVGDVKGAVEAAFSHLSEEGTATISWSHVWGQFCLRFEDQKLLDDNDSIGLYGIQDGHKLQFIRNTPVSCNLERQIPEEQDSDFEESEAPSRQSFSYDDIQKNDKRKKDFGGYEDVGVAMKHRYRWFRLLRRSVSCRGLERPDIYYQPLASNSAGDFLEVFGIYDDN